MVPAGKPSRYPRTPLYAGLPPVAGENPAVLILGSFPSALSLEKQEFYGNPRNRFWAIMETIFGIPASLPYPERIICLSEHHVALWDVIRSCERPGSADSRIRQPVPNDIAGFVGAHPTIRCIALNGYAAGSLYHRLAEVPGLTAITLPSTSPANARVSFEKKVRVWTRIRDCGFVQ